MEWIKSKKIYFVTGLTTVLVLLIVAGLSLIILKSSQKAHWEFRSIDTMKFSRDLAREKLNDPTFDSIIDRQVKDISESGVTHVAIATPYDEEFLPFLKKWVYYARKYNLKIWFRGNFSGWEQWFGYALMTRNEHLKKTEEFILNNPTLFKDGDVFSSCPECENGGPGDPRITKDISGHRNFLVKEYEVTKKSFRKIGKKVESNYASMNFDVAKLVMDRETTKKMDGIVVVDHYALSPVAINNELSELSYLSGGSIVLGEYGAPIPSIHGVMDEFEQARWVRSLLHILKENKNVIGLNYWVNEGGTTQIWDKDGRRRMAAIEIAAFYKNSLKN